MIEKQFIPYDLAIRLKELGFDEECYCWYHTVDKELSALGVTNPDVIEAMVNHDKIKPRGIKAPLWQQAFDWFVENRNVHVSIEVICKNRRQQYKVVIRKVANFGSYIESRHTFGGFDTREEAKEKALQYILETYKNFEK